MFFLIITQTQEKYRFKIYEKGLFIDVMNTTYDPSKIPGRGFLIGKRFIKYKDIISIHPVKISFFGGKYSTSIGLQIVIPKEKNKYVSGSITYSGNEIKKPAGSLCIPAFS